MPIDKTNKQVLNQLVQQYKDDIIGYEYKHWKESYASSPPRNSFCSGMIRYRNCFKVTYLVLKNGDRIPINVSLLDIIISKFINIK